jgi:hypothetical protein
MTDDANGFRLIRQHYDFQYVHYVVHGRESSALIIWRRAPAAVAATYDAAVAVAGMILLSLASFSLVLRVHASPDIYQESKKETKCKTLLNFHKNERKKMKNKIKTVTRQNQQGRKFQNDRKQSVGWLCLSVA